MTTPRVITHLPQPGETWQHRPDAQIPAHDKDETPAIVCGIGAEHNKVWDPDMVVFWVPSKKYEGSTFYLDRDSFLDRYEIIEGAQAERDRLLTEITQEMSAVNESTALLQGRLSQLGAGTPADAPAAEVSDSTTIALSSEGGVEMADRMKRTVAEIRNEVTKQRLRMEAASQRMSALARENALAIQAKMRGIQMQAQAQAARLAKMVKGAEELVWTFNLYLGKDETIRVLRDGKPAASNEKIAIRQLVLYMDEESALYSDDGGMDFSKTEEFDEWLLADPKHIDQVLPEVRGVVAIKPRRKQKGYDTGDEMLNNKLEAFNKHTYFLIRNGERVFRIDSDLEVQDTLLPKSTEFVELFERTVTDYSRRGRSKDRTETIRPGDKDYREAMEKAQGKQRHFMRVFLFLQGLLDRTTVFHPFDVPRVNVFDMMRQDEHLKFVLDAETGRMIGDGRPSFEEWQKAINSQAEVGMRVIGIFETSDRYDGRTSRTSPAWMHGPDSDELHAITWSSESGDRLRVLYDRDLRANPVYSRDPWDRRRDSEVKTPRVSVWFYRSDRKWIAYDLAKVEDMEYYLRSRINRHEYSDMFPVLTRAIEFKKKEEKDEHPFRQALVGALMRDHQVSEEDALKAVEELVKWWKYKNKIHRALLSDDEKAARMILEEYARRVRLAKERAAAAEKYRKVADEIAVLNPTAIAIYHKAYNEFVVFHPENDRDIFVNEQLWRKGRDGLKMISEDRWSTTDTNRMRNWYLLNGSTRWSGWQHDIDANKVLTDPEIAKVLDEGLAKVKEEWTDFKDRKKESSHFFRSLSADSGSGEPVFIPLATYMIKGEYYHWFWSRKARIPRKVLTGVWSEPDIIEANIEARVREDEVVAHVSYSNKELKYTPFADEEDFDDFHNEDGFPAPIWKDDEAIKAFHIEQARYDEARKKIEPLMQLAKKMVEEVTEEMRRRFLAEVRVKFDQDYGDPELWEAHLKTVKIPAFEPKGFEEAIDYAVEMGAKPIGMTVGEILDRARKLGWTGKDEPEGHDRRKGVIYTLPVDFVLPEPLAELEEEPEPSPEDEEETDPPDEEFTVPPIEEDEDDGEDDLEVSNSDD